MPSLNQYQTAAQAAYAKGEFIVNGDVFKDVGDTLYTALMIELATSEDCDSRDEAVRRVSRMISDLYSTAAERDACR